MKEPQLDLIGLVLSRWRLLLAMFSLGIGGAIAYLAIAPRWYSATLTVVPSQRSQDSGALGLAGRLPAGLDRVSPEVPRIEAVMRSASVADAAIAKFDLLKRYETSHPETARAVLGKYCVTASDRRSGVVMLTCEDQDPKRAMEMAAFFGEEGNRVFGRVSASSAREERRFLEEQVEKARKDVDDASQRLRQFQELHKIVDLPEQSKAVITAMASIKGELISKQLELSYLASFSSRTEASVIQLQQQIAIMESKLKQLEAQQQVKDNASQGSAAGSGSAKADFFPNAMNVPELRFELERLLREQKIRETVFSMMTQRYEMAKVDEARDTSTFQILDYPTLPTRHSRPRKMRTLAMALALSAAAAAILILAPVWWRRRRSVAEAQ